MVYIKSYNHLEIDSENISEIWRYAGHKGIPEDDNKGLAELLDNVIKETKGSFDYKICYYRTDIEWKDGIPILPFSTESKNLAKCLQGSSEVVMFCATIGMSIDKLIRRYERTKPAKALMFQAYGAERVEALCDTFCREIKEGALNDGKYCTPRFSPGYGDLDLSVQNDFFRLLDCSRHIGVFLNDSLLMTPSKSVTAVFGIGKEVKH